MSPRRRELPEPAREIDLHGMPVARALKFLEHELTLCRARRISPLLVITGRGWGRADGRGVLGPAVREWLARRGREFHVVEQRPTAKGGALWLRLDRDRDGSPPRG